MKLQAEIGESKYQIEIKREDDKVFADIDGRKYEIEVTEPEPNVFLLKNSGMISEVFVSPHTNATEAFHLSVDKIDMDVRLVDPKRLRGSVAAGEQSSGFAEIRTAMPGKVVRILVSAGDTVKKGDGVIVVEAMKMQNELKSPKDGVVSVIKASESNTVGAGETLMVIE
jgi:biotin carboxyl carrier protein